MVLPAPAFPGGRRPAGLLAPQSEPESGNIIQGLPAERASKMAQKDQQNGRLIHQPKQSSARFRVITSNTYGSRPHNQSPVCIAR